MKNVYLVHIYKNGMYHHTCSLAFSSKLAAQKYADHCVYYAQVEKVELLSLSDF